VVRYLIASFVLLSQLWGYLQSNPILLSLHDSHETKYHEWSGEWPRDEVTEVVTQLHMRREDISILLTVTV